MTDGCAQLVTFPAHAGARATRDGSSTTTPVGDSTVAIYALLCPKTGEVRYIGKAKNPHKRYAQHLRETGRLRRQRWIAQCIREGRAPGMRVLCWVPAAEWEDNERRIIAEHRTPSLLNIAEGGNQPNPSSEDRRASGQRLNKWVASLEGKDKFVFAFKKKIGRLHRDMLRLEEWKYAEELRVMMIKWWLFDPHMFACWAKAIDTEPHYYGEINV